MLFLKAWGVLNVLCLLGKVLIVLQLGGCILRTLAGFRDRFERDWSVCSINANWQKKEAQTSISILKPRFLKWGFF